MNSEEGFYLMNRLEALLGIPIAYAAKERMLTVKYRPKLQVSLKEPQKKKPKFGWFCNIFKTKKKYVLMECS